MEGQFPIQLESPLSLRVQVNANGSIRRMDLGELVLNLFMGSEMEGGAANLYLRRHGEAIAWTPLLGPRSPAHGWATPLPCSQRGFAMRGEWWGIRYTVALLLAESACAWFWHVELENLGDQAQTLDLIYAQDLGLADYALVRSNEYFVSQYLDHAPLVHPKRGFALASRQNLAVAGRHPWCVIGALGRGVSFASDALQVHRLAGQTPQIHVQGLPGERLQHEHAMVAIQDARFKLPPGGRAKRGFFGWVEAHHPEPTSEADLVFVDRALGLPEASGPSAYHVISSRSRWGQEAKGRVQANATRFSSALLLEAVELTEAEVASLFGADWRHLERDGSGRLLSFFTGACTHVVLKAKELAVLRPHGHILRTGSRLVPDEASMTSTVWMAGVFHSMVTQGHVAINRFLSTRRSYLGLFRSGGLRVFVELQGCWYLLDVPSAFAMEPQRCRWVYKHAAGLIAVESQALTDRHELSLTVRVLAGAPSRFLLSHHVAVNGDDGDYAVPVRYAWDGESIFVQPTLKSELGQRFPNGGFRLYPLPKAALERVGGDELLFADGRSRRQPFLCLLTWPVKDFSLQIVGQLVQVDPAVSRACPGPQSLPLSLPVRWIKAHPALAALDGLADILPWFGHNALIHYLNPRGLEQYTGGGWGTRDVTQGPVDLLLALGRFAEVKEILVRVFKNQNPDGSWPQWFMFFDRERNTRAYDAHGDIVFWPLLALGRYLLAAEDASFLEEPLPFFHPDSVQAESASLWQHVEQALAWIEGQRLEEPEGGSKPAPAFLVRYGRGDWDDSLEPADPRLEDELVSSFSLALCYQSLSVLAQGLRRLGQGERAWRLEALADQVKAAWQTCLIADGVLAGFARFTGARIDYLMHPRDRTTGVSFRLVGMVQGILAGLFTPEQARAHLALIRQHLLGPDGARLADKPLAYLGGTSRLFARAESSSFFGREIGLMYTHAHLRYAEALAKVGDGAGFLEALAKVNPIGLTERVPQAARRQANCYYTSSDAAFLDRYQAYAQYPRLLAGEIPVQGGWRVYSSGPGLFLYLVMTHVFGLRLEKAHLLIDPVMPPALNRLQLEVELWGYRLEITYHNGQRGAGPVAVELNGTELPFGRAANPYRQGAADVPVAAVKDKLKPGQNRLVVWMS